MDGQDLETAPAPVTPPATIATVTITVRADMSMNVATDPTLDRFQLIGMLTALLRAL